MKSLLYNYPPQDDPLIQQKLSSKVEFASLGLGAEQPPTPTRGNFYPHQVLDERFLRTYDNLIVYNDVGTGKTGVLYACGEHCRKNYGIDPVLAYRRGVCNTIKKIVVLASSDTLLRNIKADYVNYSTDHRSPPAQYEFWTHATFKSAFSDRPQAWKQYDNTLFVIDEVHTLITRSNIGTKKEAEADPALYQFYRDFFATLAGIKIIIMTASILVEKPVELSYYIRLFPGIDMDTSETFFERPDAEEILEKLLRGKVSFVKAVSAKAQRAYPPGSIELRHYAPDLLLEHPDMRIVVLMMSERQTKEYLEVAQRRVNKQAEVPLEHRVSLITYKGLDEEKKGKKVVSELKVVPKNINKLRLDPSLESDLLHLIDYSVKMDYVLRNIGSIGISFIVSSYVTHGTSVIGTILINNGYEEINLKKNDAVKLPQGRPKKGFIDPLLRLPEKRRFVVISADATGPEIQRIMSFTNRYENRHGAFCKIIVISPAGATGLNVFHVTNYFDMDRPWNKETDGQRQGRVFRAVSQDALWEEQKRLTGNSAPIKVIMHHLVAAPDPRYIPKELLEGEKDTPIQKKGRKTKEPAKKKVRDKVHPSIQVGPDNFFYQFGQVAINDLEDYITIYTKDTPLRYYRGRIKAWSFDAHIHQARNEVTPYTAPPKRLDRSTYDLLYGPDKVITEMRPLADLLALLGSIDVDVYWHEYGLKNISSVSFYIALLKVIRDRIGLTTSHGKTIYIHSRGNVIFAESVRYIEGDKGLARKERAYPDTSPYLHPIVYEERSLAQLIRDKESSELPYRTYDQLKAVIDNPKIGIQQKIELIEKVLSLLHNESTPEELKISFQPLRERFLGKSYFEYPRFTSLLRHAEQHLILNPKAPYVVAIPDEKTRAILAARSGLKVRVHNLYAQFNDNSGTCYSIFKNYMEGLRIRIYDNLTGVFVKVPEGSPEFIVYSQMVTHDLRKVYDDIRHVESDPRKRAQVKLLTYDPEGTPRIYNQIGRALAEDGSIATSSEPSGRVLETVPKAELASIAIYLDIDLPKEITAVGGGRLTESALLAKLRNPNKPLVTEPEILEWNLYKETRRTKGPKGEIITTESWNVANLKKLYLWLKDHGDKAKLTQVSAMGELIAAVLKKRGLSWNL